MAALAPLEGAHDFEPFADGSPPLHALVSLATGDDEYEADLVADGDGVRVDACDADGSRVAMMFFAAASDDEGRRVAASVPARATFADLFCLGFREVG